MARQRAIAALAVSVVARTSKFIKGLKKAGARLKRFGRTIAAAAKRAAKLGAALGAVAVGGMAVLIKQSAVALDELAKFSRRMGVAADQVRSFERAAELSGSSTKAFRKALTMMSKNLAEAATGIGEAKDALEELGVDAKELASRNALEAFLKIVKALERIPEGIRKTGLVADIFGTRLTELINMFGIGEQGLRGMFEESQRLFGSLGVFELGRVETMNDTFADMLRSIRGIADRLTVEVAPVITVIAKKLTDMFVGMRGKLIGALPKIKTFVIGVLNLIEETFLKAQFFVASIAADIAQIVAQLRKGIFSRLTGKEIAMARGPFEDVAGGIQQKLQGPLLGDRLAKMLVDNIFGSNAAFAKAILGQFGRRIKAQVLGFFDTLKRVGADPIGALFGRGGATPLTGKAAAVGGGAPGRTGAFKEVNLSRFALSALSGLRAKVQTVKDPASIAKLELIRQLLTRPSIAVAG